MNKRFTFGETAAIPSAWASGDGQRTAPASGDAGTVAQQVAVPLLQSLITGLGAAALVAVLSWAFWTPSFAIFGPFVAVAFVLAFAASWAVIVSDCRGLLRVAESWGSPAQAIPQPRPRPQDRIVLVRAGDGQPDAIPQAETDPAQDRDGPGDFDRFMAQALITTALGDLEKRWPRPYIQTTRDQLIRAGLATWKGKGPNAGWALTPRGRAVAERCRASLGGIGE